MPGVSVQKNAWDAMRWIEDNIARLQNNNIMDYVRNNLILPDILKNDSFLPIYTNTGWTAVVTGSGVTKQQVSLMRVDSYATASSKALLYSYMEGLANATDYTITVTWDKKIYLIFGVSRHLSVATSTARFQLKQAITEGALAEKGIGIRVDNLTLVGESFGTELGALDLATTLTTTVEAQVVIVLDPSVPKIEWYVNGVLKGTQSTAAKIPSGASTDYGYLVESILNGATASAASLLIMRPMFWQER